jgi:hypothetical protein
MQSINRILTAYLAWICRVLAVGPAQVDGARTPGGGAFAPRPEGARGFYF